VAVGFGTICSWRNHHCLERGRGGGSQTLATAAVLGHSWVPASKLVVESTLPSVLTHQGGGEV